VDRESVAAAHRLIAPHVRRTPVMAIRGDELGLDPVPITLKLELFQHTGSFKPRGAFASLLLRKAPAAGVVAASGGNHGAAVAYAAMKLGVPAKIFVPAVASPAKQQMFPIARAHVGAMALVSDDAIRAAQILLWNALRIVAEPGGAAALAALASGRYRPRAGERVGVLVCGGNTTAVDFAR
jgi:threonine dehydratase